MQSHHHPEDTPSKRFVAFWWGLWALLSFLALALVVGLIVSAGASAERANSFDAVRADARNAIREEVAAAQTNLIAGLPQAIEEAPGKVRLPVDQAVELVIRELESTKPAATRIPVPGSPLALKLLQEQAAAAAATAAEEAKQPAGAETPAAPQPEPKPTEPAQQ